MKLLTLVALLAPFCAATPQKNCRAIQHGICPGSDAIKYVPSLEGCYYTSGICYNNVNVRTVSSPFSRGCHRIQRGRCPGGSNHVYVPALRQCRDVQTGRCPGDANVLYVL
ncbi:hypothetical protein CspeluHIS016_0603610 [Cutaneotrichosporon spelunceum]|uniref:Uncharacterized protein n=1 Tax=Cutaneotrichosporon spelunceum TaxID=1672016 RepID=A0AAD3TY05_9TREE|nr:hypothetical protein CspeluHIS016_0603610 [Cutaneotrichosporon spelunceum]